METLGNDLRYAIRILVKSPGFTLVAVLALALGIGANTAIFSVFDGMLWRPLPAKNPNKLVVLAVKTKGFQFPINMSYPDFLDYRNVKQAFTDVVAEVPSPVNLSVDGRAERAWTEFVSGNFFSMLGLQAARGRTFAADEGWVKGKDPLMVLSYKFWQLRFAGDPGVIGHSVQVDNHPFTIIGVAPKEFHGTYYLIDPDFYLPVTMIPVMALDSGGILENRDDADFRILARLQPGVTPERAKAAAAPTDHRLAQEYPDSHKDFSLYVAPELKARPEPGLGEFMSARALWQAAAAGAPGRNACRGFRTARIGARHYRGLRCDFILCQPAHTGVGHSRGIGSATEGRHFYGTEPRPIAVVHWHGYRLGSGVSVAAGPAFRALWRRRDGYPDINRSFRVALVGCLRGQLYSSTSRNKSGPHDSASARIS